MKDGKGDTGDLSERHEIEERFHDEKALRGVRDFYSFGALDEADRFSREALGDLSGRSLLEIGCGDGEVTVLFAKAGARVTGIDISGEMVSLARGRAGEAGVADRVKALRMSGEDLDFPDSSFDVIYGHSILHHLNLEISARHLERLLRPGGVAVFLEPLDFNPILNLFRLLTPGRRTPTEQPLRFDQLEEIGRRFSGWEHREFYLCALVAFVWYYGIRNETMFRLTMNLFSPIDRIIFRLAPFLRRYAWVTVVKFRK